MQPAGEGTVTVEHSQRDNATQYSISKDGCTITWIARNSEKGVVLHRSQCAAPLALQVKLLENICREFFQSRENAKALRTVFWGRLEPDMPNGSRELSLRLALAAHQSPDWDARRGRPGNGDFNGFVKALANSALIYPELKELFERFHKTIRFSCAEKVLVMEAGKLPFYEQLKQHGVKASERLPFDCMTWFSVTDGAARLKCHNRHTFRGEGVYTELHRYHNRQQLCEKNHNPLTFAPQDRPWAVCIRTCLRCGRRYPEMS